MNKKISKEEIKKLIPHREPFLYVDELINIKKLDRATGIKIFKSNEYFFEGHFPGHHIVPGIILIETLAQTAAALIAYSLREETFDKIVYLMNIDSSKFRKPVFPNTIIYANVNAIRSRGRIWKFEGSCHDIKQDIICEAKWSAMIMDKNK